MRNRVPSTRDRIYVGRTSNSFAFPLNSSSRSFRRICRCIRSPSSAVIRRPSWMLFFFSFSRSVVVRDKRSCSSVRDCWAAVRSDRTAVRVSCNDCAASSCPGPGFFDTVGEDEVRWDSGWICCVAVATACTERSARRVSVHTGRLD
jgi:hypothetical protein